MATQTLTYQQVNRAWGLLSKDPDTYPDELLSKVVINRGRLERPRNEWSQKLQGVLREHAAEEQPDDLEDADLTAIEAQFGVKATDPTALRDAIESASQETVTVDLATAPLDQLREIPTNGEAEDMSEMDILSRWHFMVEG